MSTVAEDVLLLWEYVKLESPLGLYQKNEIGRSPFVAEQTGWTVESGRDTLSLNEMESVGGTAEVNQNRINIL